MSTVTTATSPLALAALLHLNPKQLALLTVGTLLYAVLFSVEGVGLWGAKVWAEYLTIVATASFIPLELYEVMKSNTVPKTVTFVLNIGIVAYLVVRVRRRGHGADVSTRIELQSQQSNRP